MLEIIADIGDDDDIVRSQDPAQAQRKLVASDPSGERDHEIPTDRTDPHLWDGRG